MLHRSAAGWLGRLGVGKLVGAEGGGSRGKLERGKQGDIVLPFLVHSSVIKE